MITVSVVMPARNAAATLEAAITSLQTQDMRDMEIVLVDHASTDATYRIMLDRAKSDKRIQVHQCSGSFVEAANLAWRAASAPLIARMDSDDIALPGRLRRQVEFLSKHSSLAGCGTQVKIVKPLGPDGHSPPDGGYLRYEAWINSVVSPESIAAQRFIDSPLPNPSTMMRRSILEAVGGYLDPPWAEDYDLWLRLLEQGYQLGKVEETLLLWQDGPHRSTRTLERYSLNRFQEAKAHYIARLPEVREFGVVLCGAGPTGKEMALLLRQHDIKIHAFIEVNQRQIGNTISGLSVFDTDQYSRFLGKAIMLSTVAR